MNKRNMRPHYGVTSVSQYRTTNITELYSRTEPVGAKLAVTGFVYTHTRRGHVAHFSFALTMPVPVPHCRTMPIALLTGAFFAAGLGFAATTPAASQYMRVQDVKPGMKGWGLTVMRGVTPERFDVEIISTLHNFRPGQDLFLVHTTHPRLKIARTVAGMSGSPIYIGGKMIGAYAYGWSFNVEPVAGVTPIHNMLADLRRPIPYAIAPVAYGHPLNGQPRGHHARTGRDGQKRSKRVGAYGAPRTHRFRGAALDYDVREHAQQVAQYTRSALSPPAGVRLRAATTDVMVGGLGPRTMSLARELLAPIGMNLLQTGGGGSKKPSATAPTRYVDGGVINVQLVRGDVSMAGLGTVTHVVGKKLVAFGHPMLGGGAELLPTSIGKVHWILSTQARSFKIGEPVRPLGALVNDRQASIVVDTTVVAPTIAVHVSIVGVPGAPKTSWNMEVAHDQFMAPNFTALAIGSAVETTAAERNDITWRAKSILHVKGYGKLHFTDFGAGNRSPVGAGNMSRTRLVRAIGAILNNAWQMGTITAVDTTITFRHKRETLTLRGAQLIETEVEAGKSARVRVTLVPHHGKPQTQVLEIPIERQLAGKKVRISLRPGYSVDRLVAAPENYSDLVRILPTLDFPGESIVASYKLVGEAAAAFHGKVAHRLPPGAADTLQSTSSSVAPEMFSATKQVVIRTPGFIVGRDTVTVKVKKAIR